MEGPESQLERAFVDEYLKQQGRTLEDVRRLPQAELMALLEAASMYAADKLAEFESRAQYIHQIHRKE